MAPRGLQVLAAIFNERAPMLLPDFLRQYRPTFPLGHSNPNDVYGYLQLSFMKLNYVPMMAFIDRGGTIRAQYTGDSPFLKDNQAANIKAALEPLLKEGETAKKRAATK